MEEKEIVRPDDNTASKPDKPPKSRNNFSRRRKHGIISIAVTLLVIAAIVIVNIISVNLTEKFSGLTADLTGLKAFGLTEQSKQLAGSISKKTYITFLADKNTYTELDAYCKQTSIIAEELSRCSQGMIEVQYIDLVRNPTFAEGYADSNLSTTDVIVNCADKKKILTAYDLYNFENFSDDYRYIASSNAEQELDNAIVSVNNEQITNAVIIKDYCSQDYSYFVNTLTNNGYSVKELSLISDSIPENTDMVIIYAPTRDYTEDAVKKLEVFLENGGKYGKTLLYAADSLDAQTPELDKLLAKADLEFKHSLAFETDTTRLDSRSQSYYDGILCSYYTDLYTENLPEGKPPVVIGYARPIFTIDGVGQPLLVLSEYSGNCPYDADEKTWKMEDSITGKECVLAQGTVGKDDAQSIVIAAGTYLLFTQEYYGSVYGNQSYLSTMLGTVNGRDVRQISVAKKVITEFDINIDKNASVTIGFIVYALIPLLILGAGLTVYLMRRNK